MKRIHRVIRQEITPPALIALVVLTFVVFSREFGRLTEILIRKNADPLTVLQVVVSILPSILIFTVPISFLVGTLIGFSRLSTESEIIAMQAGGISIPQILVPVFRAALAVTFVTLMLTLFLFPAGNYKLRQLRQEIGAQPVRSSVKPRVFNEDLEGILLYVDDIEVDSGIWQGVFLADNRANGNHTVVLASQGRVGLSPDNQDLQLFFESGSTYAYDPADPEKYGLSQFGTLDVSVSLPEIDPSEAQPKRPQDKFLSELLLDVRQGPDTVRVESLAEAHSRGALPVAALLFAVLGVTLGITTHRGGRGSGTMLSMGLAFGYYILFATGTELARRGVLPILVGVWGADILLLVGAAISLRLASRRTGAIGVVGRAAVSPVLGVLWKGLDRLSVSFHRFQTRLGHLAWKLSQVRLRFTRVIDLYLCQSFLLNWISTLAACVGLFYLFTFFELIDEVFKNSVEYSTVAEYFLYLLPHVLMLIVPISILISTLITFGLLEKTSQIIAFKACGISLYRLALPIIVLAIIVSGVTFAIQEQILPYANQRQDSLRSVIMGRAGRTFYQGGESWIFGEDGRLYHYTLFDPDRNILAGLSVYEMDVGESRLQRHISAQQAQWDRATQTWTLSSGWIRNMSADSDFTSFESSRGYAWEAPDYFVREVKASGKMNYLELGQYLDELQIAGFEVEHLRTELHKKLSFPLVSLFMVLLGIPFAFSIGKKGALYGVAAGVILGIVYWGAFGVFEVLGTNGLLSPVLAAWGPNLLFGSGSLALLLSVRT